MLATVFCSVAGSSAVAADCPDLGIGNEYLSQFFCEQLSDLAGPVTRTIRGDSDKTFEGAPPDWVQVPLIRDAWRSDPAKTLELIKRIRDAGGRPRTQ